MRAYRNADHTTHAPARLDHRHVAAFELDDGARAANRAGLAPSALVTSVKIYVE
jgi:hypothetical protein